MNITAIVAIRLNMAISCITGIIALTAIIVIFVIITIVYRCDSISRNTLYTGHSHSHRVEINFLGQGSRPFRQSNDVKKDNRAIISITAIMAITVGMAIAAIITEIRAITASTDIRAKCSQYNYYC